MWFNISGFVMRWSTWVHPFFKHFVSLHQTKWSLMSQWRHVLEFELHRFTFLTRRLGTRCGSSIWSKSPNRFTSDVWESQTLVLSRLSVCPTQDGRTDLWIWPFFIALCCIKCAECFCNVFMLNSTFPIQNVSFSSTMKDFGPPHPSTCFLIDWFVSDEHDVENHNECLNFYFFSLFVLFCFHYTLVQTMHGK